MKRIKNKLLRREKDNTIQNQRITNESVAEHREKIIKEGRRFKYPHQYVKHRLIINTILISIVSLVLVGLFGYWQLYKQQDTSDLSYRFTLVIPLPIAKVDGYTVRYSDYLLRYRSQEYGFERINRLKDGAADLERQLAFLRRESLDTLERDMYAAKIAQDRQITIGYDAVQKVIQNDLKQYGGALTNEAYDLINKRNSGLDRDEYEHLQYQALLRQEVAYTVDTRATQLKTEVAQKVGQQAFKDIARAYKGAVIYTQSDVVRRDNLDGGLTQAASHLKVGGVSGVFRSTGGDGYYVVRLLDKSEDTVQYEYLQIKLTVFDAMYAAMKKAGGIEEFIYLPETKIENR